jgi:hypothetical protein
LGGQRKTGNISVKIVISNHLSNWVLAGIDIRMTVPSPQHLKRKSKAGVCWRLMKEQKTPQKLNNSYYV